MTQCCSAGELRAYLDRELPPGDIQSLAAHLEVCSACADRCAELKERAAMVSLLVEDLTPDELPSPAPVRATPRRRTAWRWIGAAGAVAAGLAIGILTRPGRTPPVAAIQPAPPAVVQPEAVAPAAAPSPTRARTVAVRKPVRKSAAPPDDFVALDDEPVDTGVVVRVALGPTGVPADVLFGLDGKPHAIRLVKQK